MNRRCVNIVVNMSALWSQEGRGGGMCLWGESIGWRADVGTETRVTQVGSQGHGDGGGQSSLGVDCRLKGVVHAVRFGI